MVDDDQLPPAQVTNLTLGNQQQPGAGQPHGGLQQQPGGPQQQPVGNLPPPGRPPEGPHDVPPGWPPQAPGLTSGTQQQPGAMQQPTAHG